MIVTETIIAKVQQPSAEDQQKVLELICSLPSAQEKSDRDLEAHGGPPSAKASM
jgi:hypothetical protein